VQFRGRNRDTTRGANATQRDALKLALRDTVDRSSVTPVMLLAIRQICSDARKQGEGPERSLVEFKLSLTDAANELEIPLGPDRSRLFSGLVSSFIEELYRPAPNGSVKPRAFDCGDANQASP